MTRKVAFLLLTILSVSVLTVSTNSDCCRGRTEGDVELVGDCTGCNSECDCTTENCESCQGHDSCCRTCCEQRSCDCRMLKCNTCTTSSAQSSQCCSNCCSNGKSRISRCSTAKQCTQAVCDSCSGKQVQQSSCCNTCCNKQIEKKEEIRNISHITTLPNITIIINHAPIYVNNTPVINTEHRCGNASVLTNGTHIVYVYPQNSTCSNRTCCSRQVRQPCRPMPMPMPMPVPMPMPMPMPQMSCPPPMYVQDCSPRCMYQQYAPAIQQAPCQYFQTWPYVHCPQTGCYGFSCAPPMAPPPMPPMMVQGCIPVPTWPFIRCIPGMGGDSGGMVSYGPPSYQVMGPGGASPAVPFSSTDHSGAFMAGAPFAPGFPPAGPGIPGPMESP